MADLLAAFRRLNLEQKAAAVGSILLAVSTFGPFSFVEAAEILLALGVLALLRARALGKRFHLPFGDGSVIAAAGAWAAALIVVRLLDRPLGQNLLALACAAILIAAGVRERAKRPPDDIPGGSDPSPLGGSDPSPSGRSAGGSDPSPSPQGGQTPPPRGRRAGGEEETLVGERETEPLPPPEYEPYRPEPGEQLRLGGEERRGPQPPDEA
jgi:hypothetical protein